MKNAFVYLITTILIFTFFACGNSSDNKTKQIGKLEEIPLATKKESAQKNSANIPADQLKKAKSIVASANAKVVSNFDTEKKYKMLCATCHGFDGKMKVNGAKDLTASQITLEESVAQLYFGKGLMTPFKGILNDSEIVAMAKYVEGMRK